jgi:hypothetical protein
MDIMDLMKLIKDVNYIFILFKINKYKTIELLSKNNMIKKLIYTFTESL